MIRKIELNEIAHELGLSGKTLATRPVGEQFYHLALKRLNKINHGDAIELSLNGIHATDTIVFG